MVPGILVKTPKGSTYFRLAATPEKGWRVVLEQLFIFGCALDELIVDWGHSEGSDFTPSVRLIGPGATYKPDPKKMPSRPQKALPLRIPPRVDQLTRSGKRGGEWE